MWFEFETCGRDSAAFQMTQMLLHRDGVPVTVRMGVALGGSVVAVEAFVGTNVGVTVAVSVGMEVSVAVRVGKDVGTALGVTVGSW